MLLKVLFFGSSTYCLPILETLNKNFNLVCVITRPHSIVERFASDHNIKVFSPGNKEELLNLRGDLSKLKPDLVIVADYGLIIPKQIYEIPKYKTLNIHFSKLPKFRGPSPVQYTILYGEKSAWITIFILSKVMDTGDIIWKKEVPLEGSENTEGLYKGLFKIVAHELPSIIANYVSNKLTPMKQDHSKATYTRLLTREDGFIPQALLSLALKGNNPSKELLKSWQLINNFPQLLITNYQLSNFIERALRAFTPWPGLWTEITLRPLGGSRMDSPEVEKSDKIIIKRLKILKAHLEGDKLVLDEVQLEGKNPVSWKQFKEGYPNALGRN